MCGMADSASMIDASRRGDSISGSPPVRITSRIAGRTANQSIRGLQLGFAEEAAVRADMLAAEAKAAIDRADQQRLQQGAIRVAMHHALDRGQGIIRYGISALMRRGGKFGGVAGRIGVRSGRRGAG